MTLPVYFLLSCIITFLFIFFLLLLESNFHESKGYVSFLDYHSNPRTWKIVGYKKVSIILCEINELRWSADKNNGLHIQ